MNEIHNFKLEKDGDVAIITFDMPNKPVNILNFLAFDELSSIVDHINDDDEIKAAILISSKKNNFIAGADINELRNAKSSTEAQSSCVKAQNVFNKIEQSQKIFIAAIHGGCFGGGLECALACHFRIASLDPKTSFALPEVTLGILPAAGGTQRLPRLIGVRNALELLLTGKKVDSRQGKKLGLLDDVVHFDGDIKESALLFARSKKAKKKLKSLSRWSLIELWFAKKKIHKKTHGLYPAPFAIIDSVKAGVTHGFSAGLQTEAQLFGKLSQTIISKNLMNLFFAQNKRKQSPYHKKEIKSVGIIGSGLMGAGIAYVSIANDLDVYLGDSNEQALSKAKQFIWKQLNNKQQRGGISPLQKNRTLSRLITTTDISKCAHADVVIEAVFEDINVKCDVLKKVQPFLKDDFIFASNTSSIPIKQLAQCSSMPDRVVGMHYFSPVQKVPLLEIIKTSDTSEETLATAFFVGKMQQRTMIVVNDSPGFYTTRVIASLFDEATLLLLEGYSPTEIDDHLKKLGFVMGPIALMDEIGLDVGMHVSKILYDHFGSRLIAADFSLHEKMIEHKFLGRKSKRGFYNYNAHKKNINPQSKKLISSMKHEKQTDKKYSIEDRMLFRMVNEAAFCLSEQVIENKEDGDVGAVFGIGFPAYLGGPFSYIEQRGKNNIADTLDELCDHFGKRFSKAEFFTQQALC